MSVKRLTLKAPFLFQSVDNFEDFIPRYIRNDQALREELRQKVAVDTSILPPQQSGSSTPATYSLATSNDIEQTMIFNMMFH